jgi:hypothetical protein
MTKVWMAAIAAALFLAGCAATQPMNLSPQAHRAIGAVETVLFIPQTDLDVDVTPGNPGATGLLGALMVQAIDASRRAEAQKLQGTVVRAVDGFDFRSRMTRQLNAEFARVPSPRLQPAQLETVDSESRRRIALDRSPASAVLFTSVSYRLVDGRLVVSAVNRMYPKTPALMALRAKPDNGKPLDEGNAIYRTTFTFTRQSVNAGNVRAALAEGLANVAWQLAADLGHMGSGKPSTLVAPLPAAPDDAVSARAPASAPAAVAPPAVATVRPLARPAEVRPQLDDAQALPYVSEAGRDAYRAWLARPLPRAFVVSPQGGWFTTWGSRPADPSMPADVAARAMARCHLRSQQCERYAVDREVVFRRPSAP